jgi:hypothetical protein
MDTAGNNISVGTIPTTNASLERTFAEDDDVRMNRSVDDWVHLTKADFKHSISSVYRVPIAALAYGRREDNIKSPLGDIVIKYRYIIPVILHQHHMDVLLISTSTGRGGGMLSDRKKETCVGLTKESVHEYANPFPNAPVRIPEDSRYPAINGAWLDVTYTYPISYDSRVVKIDMLPEEEANYLMDLFEYFRTEELCRCSSRHVNLEALEEDRTWYEKMRKMALQDEQDRRVREETKYVCAILFLFV